MTREQLINAVKVRMDNITDDGSIEIVGNANVDYMLDGQLKSAFMFLPAYMLPQTSFLGAIGVGIVAGVSRVTLPDDFLRLVVYRTSEMKRPLTEAQLVREGSPEHSLMFGKYTGGGKARPVGCITYDNSLASLVLEYSASSSNAGTAVDAQYIAIPEPSDVTDELLDPVAWYIASAVLGSMGKETLSQYAMNKVNEYLKLK